MEKNSKVTWVGMHLQMLILKGVCVCTPAHIKNAELKRGIPAVRERKCNGGAYGTVGNPEPSKNARQDGLQVTLLESDNETTIQ